MFERLTLAYAAFASGGRRSVAASSSSGSGGATKSKAKAKSGTAAAPPPPAELVADFPGAKDPEPPAATVSLVERCRLRVDPLTPGGGRVPCGPFEWKWDEKLGKLEVSRDTTWAWFYPVALGACPVTVLGGDRESTITVNVVEAAPATLNLVADTPEVFRDLATAKSGGVDTAAAGVM